MCDPSCALPAFQRAELISLDFQRLLQCWDMADWRQIQARIRKAKNSPDAQAKLSDLFQRTRDAMVAWELGAIEEKAEHRDEAGHWYTIAAQRFRRSDWRKKAEDALTRLGVELPPPWAETKTIAKTDAGSQVPDTSQHESFAGGSALAHGETPPPTAEEPSSEPASPPTHASNAGELGHRKRRRGRRGGRGRRRKSAGGSPGLPGQAPAEQAAPEPSAAILPHAHFVERRPTDRNETGSPQEVRAARAEPAPQLPSERAAYGRAGDPALASRMANLESKLRRLLASPVHRLHESEDAPAGPGVFLLSDSDQITSYYVEACQTLRIGCANLARGGRSGKSARGGGGASDTGLKAKLAGYLGINEAKVSQYMKDHCVVRWIQLDDDAQLLAHFAIGVLSTPLNLD